MFRKHHQLVTFGSFPIRKAFIFNTSFLNRLFCLLIPFIFMPKKAQKGTHTNILIIVPSMIIIVPSMIIIVPNKVIIAPNIVIIVPNNVIIVPNNYGNYQVKYSTDILLY